MKKSARLAQKPLSSVAAVAGVPVPPSVPRMVIASGATPSADQLVARALGGVSGVIHRGQGSFGHGGLLCQGWGYQRRRGLPADDLRLLGAQPHRLANDLRAAASGDPDLFLEDQPGPDDQLLLEDGDDQHPVLLAHRGHGLDRHASGTRSTVTSSCRSAISAISSRSSTRVRTTTRPRSTSRLLTSAALRPARCAGVDRRPAWVGTSNSSSTRPDRRGSAEQLSKPINRTLEEE